MTDEALKIFPIIELKGSDFKDRLKKLKPFMSTEETRYYLMGAFLAYKGGELALVATNGHILQEQVFNPGISESGEDFEVIMPDKAVDMLIHILNITEPSYDEDEYGDEITTGTRPVYENFTLQVIDGKKKQIKFKFVDFEYTVYAIDGSFPDYKRALPKEPVAAPQSILDAGYLIHVLEALGSKAGVSIFINKDADIKDAPHLLTNKDGIKCAIMPMVRF